MKNKILLVLCILFGLMFINSGLNKFFEFVPMSEDVPEELVKLAEAFKSIVWLMPLVGAVEVIAGILIMIPKYRALAAIMILPIMVGILLVHTVNDTSGLPVALPLFLINIWVIIENRKKYTPMIGVT